MIKRVSMSVSMGMIWTIMDAMSCRGWMNQQLQGHPLEFHRMLLAHSAAGAELV
jgi:hypothetical protein